MASPPSHIEYDLRLQIVGRDVKFFLTSVVCFKGLGLSQNEKMRFSAARLGCAFFRCGYSPDLLATLQVNPGQPTPFFASVSTLAVLALPLTIALTRTFVLVIIGLRD